VTTLGRPGRKLARIAATTTAAAAALSLLAACGSSASTDTGASGASSSTSASTGASSPSAAAQGSGSSAVPTQDVVSAIQADPKLKAELPAAVRSSGTLILGTTLAPGTAGLPHAGENAAGQNIGLDVDLRNAVAKVLGVTWNVQYGTFPTVIPGVQNGKYDVGQDNFGVTKVREKVVNFSTYLNDGQSFLGGASTQLTSVTSLTDLCGLTVATSPGTTFQQILTAGASKCAAAGKSPYKVQYFSDNAPIFLGLANGKIDVEFGPTLSLKYDALHIAGTKYLGQTSVTPVGFVTAKNSPLAKALSDAVNELIANGDYAKIFAKWGVTGTGVSESQVNPTPAL
jgi:polar amino acid transport system substrate-binding protein